MCEYVWMCNKKLLKSHRMHEYLIGGGIFLTKKGYLRTKNKLNGNAKIISGSILHRNSPLCITHIPHTF